MPHVLVAGKLHPSGIELLDASPDVTYDYVEDVSEPSYAPLIGKADGLVIRTQPLSAADGRTRRAAEDRVAPRRRLRRGRSAVAQSSAASRSRSCGDVNSVSVAEHAMMLLLAAAKRLIRADRSVRDSDWGWRNRLEPGELAGKRLLILGFGRIGRHLARMAAAFGMEVRAFDPFLERQGWPEGPVAPVSELADGPRLGRLRLRPCTQGRRAGDRRARNSRR